jgi:hypothetical protein
MSVAVRSFAHPNAAAELAAMAVRVAGKSTKAARA